MCHKIKHIFFGSNFIGSYFYLYASFKFVNVIFSFVFVAVYIYTSTLFSFVLKYRAIWTHGGPTSAFIHILIALCLLIPRLLLESKLIKNGNLPRGKKNFLYPIVCIRMVNLFVQNGFQWIDKVGGCKSTSKHIPQNIDEWKRM